MLSRVTDNYEMNIGLEVHVQVINDESNIKAFSNAVVNNDEFYPNKNVAFFDYGLPGSLPKFNYKIAEFATRGGHALNCKIHPVSVFDDKNYLYVDVCGRQVTQFHKPIATDGYIELLTEHGIGKKIDINRIHIEHDAGKSVHNEKGTCVDFNRAGAALLEIVTEPCIYSFSDVRYFIKTLRCTLKSINVSWCNMDKGEMRVDLSISIRPAGSQTMGTRVEIKNINSVNFAQKAAEYEFRRQVDLVSKGGKIVQETRLFDVKTCTTKPMRTKEDASDYLYLPDHNLPPLELSEEFINAQKPQELPIDSYNKLVKDLGITPYEAYTIISEAEYLQFFNKVSKTLNSTKAIKIAARWMIGDLFGLINNSAISLTDFNIEWFIELIKMLEEDKVSGKAGKELLKIAFEENKSPAIEARARGFEQTFDSNAIENAISQVFKCNPKEIERYRNGETKLFGFLVGQCMKQLKNANPNAVNELLRKKLSASQE